MVRVKELMKQDLASVNCGDLVSLAATLMRIRRIGSVFVKQNGHIVGIVTEADIVRKVVSTHRSPDRTTVETIMTAPVIRSRCADIRSGGCDVSIRHPPSGRHPPL
ncbi:MAG TPA: CBS domain-containing protein [Nitrospirales bacterium]|nr:CBS domain-containing protein [Nitrospirales bacterium]